MKAIAFSKDEHPLGASNWKTHNDTFSKNY